MEPGGRIKRLKIKLYTSFKQNKDMDGVDLHRNVICNYPRKMWRPLFCNSFESLVVNITNILNETNRSWI